MAIFGLIVCFIILLVIQHVGHVLIRKAWQNDDNDTFTGLLSLLLVLSFTMSYIIVLYVSENPIIK